MNYSVPEIKQINMGNVLETVSRVNALNQSGEDQQNKMKTEKIKMSAEAMIKSLGQKDPESAKAVYKAYFPEEQDTPDFSFIGDEVTVDSPMGTITGKKKAVEELYAGMTENPDFFSKAENIEKAVPYLVRSGISKINIKDQKTARVYDIINGKVVEDSPQNIESMQLAKPEQYQTVEQRTAGPKWSPLKEGMIDGKPAVYRVDDKNNVQVVKGVQPKAAKGMKVYDKDGNLIVDTGGGEPMTNKTKGAIEEKILNQKDQLARLAEIEADFKPEYLQMGTRLKNSWVGLKSSFGRNVSPEDEAELRSYDAFRRKAIANTNQTIHDLTGAAMSIQEAKRIRMTQPDAGENWYNADNPISFKSKLDDAMKTSKAAIARYQHYKAKGLSDAKIKELVNSDKAIPLSDIMARMK
jgi:hypothetical protein